MRTYRLPDSDRLWLSAGASYKATERISLDAGYTFILAEEADLLPAGGGGPIANGPFAGESDGQRPHHFGRAESAVWRSCAGRLAEVAVRQVASLPLGSAGTFRFARGF